MFITKKRHESEIENRDDEISRLRGARMMDAETIRFQSAEIDRLRSLAQKHLDKLARDRKRVRGGAKVSVKPAVKKGAGK